MCIPWPLCNGASISTLTQSLDKGGDISIDVMDSLPIVYNMQFSSFQVSRTVAVVQNLESKLLGTFLAEVFAKTIK